MSCNCEGKTINIGMGCCQPVLGPIENYYNKWEVDKLIESATTSGCCITPEEVDEKIDEAISGITVSGVTEEQMNEAIASAKTQIEAEIPTVPTNVSAFENDVPYLTEHQSLSGYATEQWVEDKHYISGVDLSNYATKDEIPTVPTKVSAFENDVPYLTEHQSLTAYSTTDEVTSMINQSVSGKQDTLSAGTGIDITNNVISCTVTGGTGGKAILAGRGINVTTGATADTVSVNIPISAGTGNNSIKEGQNTEATGSCAHSEGNVTKAYGTYAHAEGRYTIASGSCAHAEGSGTTAGNRSHAEGLGTYADGVGSHAEGRYTDASNSSHAEGTNTLAIGSSSHAEGQYTTASGSCAHAEGQYTIASNYYSHAEGNYTIANGDSSHAEGTNTIANNYSEHACGMYNMSNTGETESAQTLFSVGNGANDNSRHNAFEIRKNGDIYFNNGTSDVKLQDELSSKASTAYIENNYLLKSKIWCGTENEYNSIITKDPETLYLIHS